MSTMLYVVSAEDIDIAALDLPVYIEAQAGGPMLGANNIAVVRCGGSRADDGYEAIKAVYPDAVKTLLKSKAIHLASSMRGGRLQIASNVSAETKAQVDELVLRGYSVRDVVTLGIEMLYRDKITNFKEYRGDNIVVELHQQGDVISYRLYGQSISETVGTSRLSEADLLDVLLNPMNLCVISGMIVTRPEFPQMVVVRDGIACDVNAVEVGDEEPVFDRIDVSGQFMWYSQCNNYRNHISVDYEMKVYGGWRS